MPNIKSNPRRWPSKQGKYSKRAKNVKSSVPNKTGRKNLQEAINTLIEDKKVEEDKDIEKDEKEELINLEEYWCSDEEYERGSFETRCYLSGLRFNKGIAWHSSPWKKTVSKSPGKYCKKYIQQEESKLEKRREKIQSLPAHDKKKRAKIETKLPDHNYGPKALQEALTEEELNLEKHRILNRLQLKKKVDTRYMNHINKTETNAHKQLLQAKGEHTTVGPPLPLSKLLHMSIPPSHTALSGDLHVQVHGTWPSDASTLQLRLSRLDGAATHQLYAAAARPDARALGNATTHGNSTGTTVLRLPCGLFSKGGEYYVELVRTEGNKSQEEEEEEDKVAKGLDVRWPLPRLSLTPEHVPTYPELPVTAILEFPEVMCPPVADAAPAAIPEFWLELHYCGHSLLTCDHHNQTHSPQVLYSEQIRGFPGRRMVTLRCELFGLAGHYALLLRPTTPMPSLSNTAAYVKADWSEQFVFNVHARSILPCDVHSGGIPVLFQYPSCILSAGDRVRLFARLRADVGSLAPPTSLEYVAERRVVRGQHSLHFDCELFSERYVEYCFVYVSQAITGAVADVRMDCVPTLPVSESESGGWGAWSAWTPCSSTCAGGTRNRYRFCDSPPPRYGAKFCEGNAVETEKCGGSNDLVAGTDWDCMYSGGDSGSAAAPGDISPADRPEVLAEVGPGCRCGCVVHLGHAKPRRLLATSSHSCPGRTFWLIQADVDHAVRFKVDHYRLPCGSQWLKVRDGSSLSATLLAQLSGGGERRPTAPAAVQSTGQHLLLEFFSDELMAGGEACGGGFLAHAMQIRLVESNTTLTSSASASTSSVAIASSTRLTAYHAAALLLASVVLVATALLAAQYVLRYRKYTLAEDLDSLAESGAGTDTGVALRTRAASSTTLLSEVISLTRLRPPRRHTRLRESMDVGDVEMETREQGEALCSERTDEHPEGGSHCSTLTLTPEDRAVTPALSTRSAAASVSTKERSAPASPTSLRSATSAIPITAFTQPPALLLRRHRRPSLVTSPVAALTNGCYSPAASIISTATIRSMNAKESKEKRNRERLLTGPVGSEFSLANTDIDLELDYYDYNVVNAGAVPGSYLGMDPQYLVWIPPLDEGGEILENLDKLPYEFEDIRPKQYIDPGSNQESPEEEVLIPKQRRRSISECNSKQSPVIISKRVHPLKLDTTDASDVNVAKELSPLLKRVDSSRCAIPLHEFPKRLGLNSPAKVHRPSEKETKVEKSPSQKSYDLDDIKFADDECEEEAGDTSDVADVQCNKKPYQDSNIITSS